MWVTWQLLRVWEANLETFYCISAFVCSSLDPHHCVLVVFLVFPSCRHLQMRLKWDFGSISLFVRTGILPFLYCSLFYFTNTETFLEIGKIQFHPFDLQKSLCLSVRQYIYFTTGWFSKDHQVFTVINTGIWSLYQVAWLLQWITYWFWGFFGFYGLLISVCFITTFRLGTIWNSTILKKISDLGTVKENEMPQVCQVIFTVVKWRLHWCGRDSWFHYHLQEFYQYMISFMDVLISLKILLGSCLEKTIDNLSVPIGRQSEK